MRLPKAILFDLDDTIVAYSVGTAECWRLAVEHLGDCAGQDGQQRLLRHLQEYSRWFWSDPQRHRAGRLDLLSARTAIAAEGLQRLGIEDAELAGRIGREYARQRDARMQRLPGAVEALRRLRADGVRTALLTNGAADVQGAKIDRFGLRGLFDCIVIEGEFGCGKPDRRVFEHAMSRLGVRADETWMVGDNLEWDVAGAQAVGVFGIWNDYEGAGLPAECAVRPDRVVRSVAQLS